MTNGEGIDQVIGDISKRANAIVEEGHSQIDIMKSALSDFKALGNINGMLAVMNSGTLNKNQVELARRIAVKAVAVLGIIEAGNNKGA